MPQPEITRLLQAAAKGDAAAFASVAEWAYDELERLAAQRLRRHYGAQVQELTLEPAAVVNETFLKLLKNPIGFDNRQHFLGFVSKVMLRVLIDYDRARSAGKRGGEAIRVTLTGSQPDDAPSSFALSAFADVLDELDRLDARKAAVAKLRLIWGFEMAEISGMLEVSTPTVERDWRFARNWLALQLGDSQ